MSWETVAEIFATPAALLTALMAVSNVVVKINKTLCSLEIAVNELKKCIEKQSEKNGEFYSSISDHEVRINNLEYKVDGENEHTKKSNK